MKIEDMSKEILEYEIVKSKASIADFEKILNYLPENSILGRLSVKSYLRREERRLAKLENELKKRV